MFNTVDVPSRAARRGIRSPAAAVAAAYLAIALVTTWPLARVMTREIAGDLGDPLLNGWIMLWTGGQLLRFLRGDVTALAHYWHGNIFYPNPLTLAYSEHLTPQMLQALPVLAATHNVVLAYNLVLVATIVLSGVGAYLLVRELTGAPLAAFLAGAAFAYAPYRIDQWSHLQVLSSQWMPLALYGFRRFLVAGRMRALAGGTAALVAQALSCGYYMAYFTPFAVAYCLYELAARGRLRDRRTWTALLAAAAAATVLIGLFLWPYLQARGLPGIGVRDVNDVQQFSLDTHAFATISDRTRLWGGLIQSWPRNEGQGFPGFTVLLLAAAGLGASVTGAIRRARHAQAPWWRAVFAWSLGTLLLVHVALLAHLLWTGRATVVALGVPIRLRYHPLRIGLQLGALTMAFLVVSARSRQVARDVLRSPAGFFAAAAMLAALLALGPTVMVKGQPLGPGLYAALYRWAPLFDGLRVPALNLMLVTLFLSVLAGLGAAAICAHRTGRIVVIVALIALIAESWGVPLETHAPPQLAIAGVRAEPTAVYQLIRELPEGVVIAELPLGDVFDEAGYTLAAGYHRKSIVNGYSGFFPGSYERLKKALADPDADVRAVLVEAGATHAIVHETLFADRARARALDEGLRAAGAEDVSKAGTDRVFRLR
jgi:hypothetical protein